MISKDTLTRLDKSFMTGETRMNTTEIKALQKYEKQGVVKIIWAGDPVRPHCEDEPAVRWLDSTGLTLWMIHGQWHREDGPAIYGIGGCNWFIDGKIVESYEEFQCVTNCSSEDIIMLKLRWGIISKAPTP